MIVSDITLANINKFKVYFKCLRNKFSLEYEVSKFTAVNLLYLLNKFFSRKIDNGSFRE
jgi:hypothetical protein